MDETSQFVTQNPAFGLNVEPAHRSLMKKKINKYNDVCSSVSLAGRLIHVYCNKRPYLNKKEVQHYYLLRKYRLLKVYILSLIIRYITDLKCREISNKLKKVWMIEKDVINQLYDLIYECNNPYIFRDELIMMIKMSRLIDTSDIQRLILIKL